MSLSSFSEDDVKKLREFGFFLNQRAVFNHMSIPDSVKLLNHLQDYNKIASKIEDHILEVLKVHQKPKEQSEPSKEKPVKKS